MKMISVQSYHQCKSVVQTFYDIVKAHGGKLNVEILPAEAAAQAFKESDESTFAISLTFKNAI